MKPPRTASTQEECGVWLDTVQLKGKVKQKKTMRPISRLLNPLSGNGGYSLAVALNFTLTKMEIPNTKQSSISSFFSPQRRVLNKKSSSEEPHTYPDCSSSSASTKYDPGTSMCSVFGTKRKHNMVLNGSDLCNTEEPRVKTPCVNSVHEGKGIATENVETVWQDSKNNGTTSPNGNRGSEEEEAGKELNEPERMSLPTETCLTLVKPDPLLEQCRSTQWNNVWCSQNSRDLVDSRRATKPFDVVTQESKSHFDLTHQEYSTERWERHSGAGILESLQSEESFRTCLGAKERTSTQKVSLEFHASQSDKKENNSPCLQPQHDHLSFTSRMPHPLEKWTDTSGHLSCQPWKKAEAVSFVSSPRKKEALRPSRREVHEDSLDMLFTQDSQGFRVIAHRALSARSSLKDQSNLRFGREKSLHSYSSMMGEEEVLFTKDTQGNMVIKH